MKFLVLIFSFSIILFSCKSKQNSLVAQTKNFKQKENIFTILSAEESTWFGGREGVKGKNYTLKLKLNKNIKYFFKDLNINGEAIPVKISINKGVIYVTAITSENNQPQIYEDVASSTVNSAKTITSEKTKEVNFLEYTLGTSKTIHKLIIPIFVEKSTTLKSEEARTN